jgi:ribonuclease E
VALYILNQKRDSLVQLEARYAIRVLVARDDTLIPPAFRLERLRTHIPAEPVVSSTPPLTQAPISDEEEEEIEEEIEETAEAAEVDQENGEGHARSRRRRRRRRRHEDGPASHSAPPQAQTSVEPMEDASELGHENGEASDGEEKGEDESDAERRRRRRGRRGGRRRGRREDGTENGFEGPRPAADTVEILPTPEVEESEPTIVEARASWPIETRAAAIETASLPALAGDPSPNDGDLAPPSEAEPGAAEPAGSDAYEMLHPQPPRQMPEAGGESQTGSPPTAEAEEGIPYLSETERELEPASAGTERQHTPEPAHPVETVTEKPVNPRRGWWQRLIQS